MAYGRATELAHRAAFLIPGPPAAHDTFGYLAWEELVLGAATRLGARDADPAFGEWAYSLLYLSPVTGQLDAEALTTLATVVRDDGPAAGEALLQMSVDAWRNRATSRALQLTRHA